MTDRELLELAAKAARHVGFCFEDGLYWIDGPLGPEGIYPVRWNPIADDGDAFRLLVFIKRWSYQNPSAWDEKSHAMKMVWDGLCAALDSGDATRVRRAVVVFAAEIGRSMP